MKPIFISLLAVSLLMPLGAIEIEKIHVGLTREQARHALPDDYNYTVLSDASVRREWTWDDRSLALDFSPKSGKLLYARLEYGKPVSMKAATQDMQAMARTTESSWRKGVAEKLRPLGFEKARFIKLGSKTFFFAQQNTAGKVVALHLHTSVPKGNRNTLRAGSTKVEQTGLGSSDGVQAQLIAHLQKEEAAIRQSAPLAARPKPAPTTASTASTLRPKPHAALARLAAQSSAASSDESTSAAEQKSITAEPSSALDMKMILMLVGGAFAIAILYALCFAGKSSKRR